MNVAGTVIRLVPVALSSVPPNLHRYAKPASKREPYTVTFVLPETGPLVGLKADTRGAA